VFSHVNKKENGKISREELAEAFSEYSVLADEQEIDRIFYAADLNKDGYIDFQEWKTAMLIR